MPRGRPREFDTEQALFLAMKLFWQQGYQKTSLDDLAKTMNVTKPSLYAAFGDKEQLFLKAFDRYSQVYGGRVRQAVAAQADVGEAVKAYLNTVADILSDVDNPAGCMLVNSTIECHHLSKAIERKIIEYKAQNEAVLYDRLRQAQIEGQIPIEEDIQALARFFVSVGNAMAVIAKVYPDPIRIRQMVEIAMRALPVKASNDIKQKLEHS
ncbi:TetR/AcrR family transcriptional regulator [Myxosarcina sp. GI1(2024)]